MKLNIANINASIIRRRGTFKFSPVWITFKTRSLFKDYQQFNIKAPYGDQILPPLTKALDALPLNKWQDFIFIDEYVIKKRRIFDIYDKGKRRLNTISTTAPNEFLKDIITFWEPQAEYIRDNQHIFYHISNLPK